MCIALTLCGAQPYFSKPVRRACPRIYYGCSLSQNASVSYWLGWRQPEFYRNHHKFDVGNSADDSVAEWTSTQGFESTIPRYRVKHVNLDAILPVTIIMA